MLTLSTFRIGDDLFGVEAASVKEATREWNATPVPLAPADVVGLMNLRGEVVALVDLRRRLGYPDRSPAAGSVNLVVRVHGESVGLLVDELADFVSVDPARAGDVPPHALPGVRQAVDTAFQLPRTGASAEHGVVLLLNVDRAAEVASSVRRGPVVAREIRQVAGEAEADSPSVSVASGRQP